MKRRDFLKGLAVTGAAVGSATTGIGPFVGKGMAARKENIGECKSVKVTCI